MTDRVELRVLGDPRAKGSKVPMLRYGKCHCIEGDTKEGRRKARGWTKAILEAWRLWKFEHGDVIYDEPVRLRVTFFLPRPGRPRFPTPGTRPDFDKLARLLCDALTGQVYRDDGLIVSAHVHKRWATVEQPPGALVVIEPFEG